MKVFTTRQAADEAGCSVRQWHYLTGKHDMEPTAKADGIRGAMVWTLDDVERVRSLLGERAA